MSFSLQAKNEICAIKQKDCCIIAMLYALTLDMGTYTINSSGTQIKYNTESKVVAKHIYTIVTKTLKMEADIEVKESSLKKINTYTIIVWDAQLLFEVLDIKATMFFTVTPGDKLLKKKCCKVAFLQGLFLGSGTVSNPKKNYHLEFVLNSVELAKLLQNTLNFFKINAKSVLRKQLFVVYLNEGDSIINLLTLLGAYTSILNFENVRILKEMRNNVNRAVNCETANINKTVNAALSQLASINIIEKYYGLENLSENLYTAAIMRRENPEATLQELCEMCNTTKSGMNHRLRKIKHIANMLKEEKEEIL